MLRFEPVPSFEPDDVNGSVPQVVVLLVEGAELVPAVCVREIVGYVHTHVNRVASRVERREGKGLSCRVARRSSSTSTTRSD